MKEGHNELLLKYLNALEDNDGVSNAEVGRLIGKSRSQMSKLKKGNTKVTRSIIIAIEEKFPHLIAESSKDNQKTLPTEKYIKALEQIARLERENKELLIEAMELKKAMELNGEKVSQEVLKLIKELEEIQDKKASIDFDFIQQEIKRIIKRKN